MSDLPGVPLPETYEEWCAHLLEQHDAAIASGERSPADLAAAITETLARADSPEWARYTTPEQIRALHTERKRLEVMLS